MEERCAKLEKELERVRAELESERFQSRQLKEGMGHTLNVLLTEKNQAVQEGQELRSSL